MLKIEKGKYYLWIKALWMSFAIGLLLVFLVIWSIHVNFLGLFGEMPSLEALENPRSELSSEMYSADGKLMGKYFLVNRSPIEYDEISPYVINALLATEDIRFEEHSGVDFRAVVRAVTGLGKEGGASTLTQQLAKNLFDTRSEARRGRLTKVKYVGKFIVKIQEWILAIRLERNYTKKEILAMYLNTCEFGSNSFGIQTAAKTFFSKEASELNLLEAAMLVGMLQAPTRYSPISNPERCLKRRNVVLGQMMKYNFISKADFDAAKVTPIALQYKPDDNTTGIAPYFRNEALKFLKEWAKEKGYPEDFVYTGGLKIYTTIDSRVQQYAEEAMVSHMKEKQELFYTRWKGRNPWVDEYGREIPNYIEKEARKTYAYRLYKKALGDDEAAIFREMNKPKKMKVFTWDSPNFEKDTVLSSMDSIRYFKHFLHTGFMAMEPKTGNIRAWVGGINYKYFQYDHVKQGKRQPGSTFKPIVYAAALDMGYTPCYEMIDRPVVFSGWIPRNSYGTFTGASLTLRKALGMSVNSIAAQIMKELGPDVIIKYAKNLGIETPLPRVASICLGSSAVSMFELLSAYGVFANRGYHTKPQMITKILDKDGKILEEFSPEIKEVISEEVAYQMIHMLRAALEAGGTSTRLSLYGDITIKNDIGAKTGTTQNNADAWFVGVTQDLMASVWVGGDDMHIRFLSIYDGQGAMLALPMYGKFMQKIYADKSLPYKKRPFERPERLRVELDCNKVRKERPRISRYDENEDKNKRKTNN
jgi:penicillin-binding protein 1A